MTDTLSQKQQALIQAAVDARKHAYARYSSYQVGAALLCDGGQIITGCNVENASYGLTICAERVAIFNAISQGLRKFTALAIATADGGPPCGACRQVMSEFSKDLPILLVAVDRPNEVVATSLDVLLPLQFELDRP